MFDNVYMHMGLDWTLENLNFLEGTKTLILTGLGGWLNVQPLSKLEQIEMMLVKTMKNMGGQILGYNSCPCSIFLNLIRKYGTLSFVA